MSESTISTHKRTDLFNWDASSYANHYTVLTDRHFETPEQFKKFKDRLESEKRHWSVLDHRAKGEYIKKMTLECIALADSTAGVCGVLYSLSDNALNNFVKSYFFKEALSSCFIPTNTSAFVVDLILSFKPKDLAITRYCLGTMCGQTTPFPSSATETELHYRNYLLSGVTNFQRANALSGPEACKRKFFYTQERLDAFNDTLQKKFGKANDYTSEELTLALKDSLRCKTKEEALKYLAEKTDGELFAAVNNVSSSVFGSYFPTDEDAKDIINKLGAISYTEGSTVVLKNIRNILTPSPLETIATAEKEKWGASLIKLIKDAISAIFKGHKSSLRQEHAKRLFASFTTESFECIYRSTAFSQEEMDALHWAEVDKTMLLSRMSRPAYKHRSARDICIQFYVVDGGIPPDLFLNYPEGLHYKDIRDLEQRINNVFVTRAYTSAQEYMYALFHHFNEWEHQYIFRSGAVSNSLQNKMFFLPEHAAKVRDTVARDNSSMKAILECRFYDLGMEPKMLKGPEIPSPRVIELIKKFRASFIDRDVPMTVENHAKELWNYTDTELTYLFVSRVVSDLYLEKAFYHSSYFIDMISFVSRYSVRDSLRKVFEKSNNMQYINESDNSTPKADPDLETKLLNIFAQIWGDEKYASALWDLDDATLKKAFSGGVRKESHALLFATINVYNSAVNNGLYGKDANIRAVLMQTFLGLNMFFNPFKHGLKELNPRPSAAVRFKELFKDKYKHRAAYAWLISKNFTRSELEYIFMSGMFSEEVQGKGFFTKADYQWFIYHLFIGRSSYPALTNMYHLHGIDPWMMGRPDLSTIDNTAQTKGTPTDESAVKGELAKKMEKFREICTYTEYSEEPLKTKHSAIPMKGDREKAVEDKLADLKARLGM